MKTSFAILALCLTAACGGSGGGATTSTMTAPTGGAPVVIPTSQSFAGMLNDVRSDNGAAPVAFDSRLGRAAQVHANDMLANNFFDHAGSDGSNAGQRIRAQGYNFRTWGENIAKGQQSESAALRGWVNSPRHQANNVNPSFEDFGLAKAGSGSNTYWVLVLAAEN